MLLGTKVLTYVSMLTSLVSLLKRWEGLHVRVWPCYVNTCRVIVYNYQIRFYYMTTGICSIVLLISHAWPVSGLKWCCSKQQVPSANFRFLLNCCKMVTCNAIWIPITAHCLCVYFMTVHNHVNFSTLFTPQLNIDHCAPRLVVVAIWSVKWDKAGYCFKL